VIRRSIAPTAGLVEAVICLEAIPKMLNRVPDITKTLIHAPDACEYRPTMGQELKAIAINNAIKTTVKVIGLPNLKCSGVI